MEVRELSDGEELVEAMAALVGTSTSAESGSQDLGATQTSVFAGTGPDGGSAAAAELATRPLGARPRWPDVVCLDCSMVRLDGPAAWARVRDMAAGSPFVHSVAAVRVIGVSGHSGARDLKAFADAGVGLTMVKPVDPEKLHELITASKGKVQRTGRRKR